VAARCHHFWSLIGALWRLSGAFGWNISQTDGSSQGDSPLKLVHQLTRDTEEITQTPALGGTKADEFPEISPLSSIDTSFKRQK
jgi:hypothetical protein